MVGINAVLVAAVVALVMRLNARDDRRAPRDDRDRHAGNWGRSREEMRGVGVSGGVGVREGGRGQAYGSLTEAGEDDSPL